MGLKEARFEKCLELTQKLSLVIFRFGQLLFVANKEINKHKETNKQAWVVLLLTKGRSPKKQTNKFGLSYF